MSDDRPNGLLMALMEPDRSGEKEFNDWYDPEHIPQMSAVTGFLTASRWVCVEGWPRYLGHVRPGEHRRARERLLPARHGRQLHAVGTADPGRWCARLAADRAGRARPRGRRRGRPDDRDRCRLPRCRQGGAGFARRPRGPAGVLQARGFECPTRAGRRRGRGRRARRPAAAPSAGRATLLRGSARVRALHPP